MAKKKHKVEQIINKLCVELAPTTANLLLERGSTDAALLKALNAGFRPKAVILADGLTACAIPLRYIWPGDRITSSLVALLVSSRG